MLRLADGPPRTVLLIDGLFETARAPWHKEILVLLSAGFSVFGAASIGALRAAELARFGMRPLGGVARAYIDGRIVGDDEVAVVHAPRALGYRPLSVAQVDVRATLLSAVRSRVAPPEAARELLTASRAIFFKDRTWGAVAETARAVVGLRSALPAWLLANAVAYKTLDASLALDRVRIMAPRGARYPAPPDTVFVRRLRIEASRESQLQPSP